MTGEHNTSTRRDFLAAAAMLVSSPYSGIVQAEEDNKGTLLTLGINKREARRKAHSIGQKLRKQGMGPITIQTGEGNRHLVVLTTDDAAKGVEILEKASKGTEFDKVYLEASKIDGKLVNYSTFNAQDQESVGLERFAGTTNGIQESQHPYSGLEDRFQVVPLDNLRTYTEMRNLGNLTKSLNWFALNAISRENPISKQAEQRARDFAKKLQINEFPLPNNFFFSNTEASPRSDELSELLKKITGSRNQQGDDSLQKLKTIEAELRKLGVEAGESTNKTSNKRDTSRIYDSGLIESAYGDALTAQREIEVNYRATGFAKTIDSTLPEGSVGIYISETPGITRMPDIYRRGIQGKLDKVGVTTVSMEYKTPTKKVERNEEPESILLRGFKR
tara:strand:+ start:1785 stop:2954 length:1170 start_codon:yes stop_codon:yes gene_type:complete